jgi:hypothetical protein
VPAFGRFGPDGLRGDADVERLLATADVVMRRRGRELTPVLEALYRSLAGAEPRATEPERRRKSA